MLSKDEFCYDVMQVYSLVVDFEGYVRKEKVGKPNKEETFKKWKDRVFGPEVSNLTVYMPTTPYPLTKMKTVMSVASASHLNSVSRALDSKQRSENAAAIARAKLVFSTIPKDVLSDVLLEPPFDLDPAVEEFLQRFVDREDLEVDVESFVHAIIRAYNDAARTLRAREARNKYR